MNVFGNTRGRANDLYVKLGLKKRTNDDVRDAFLKEIHEKCDEVGLDIPEYREEDQPR